jgi:hypothetical protein
VFPPAHGEAYGEGCGALCEAVDWVALASRAMLGGKRGCELARLGGSLGAAGGMLCGAMPGW